MWTKPTADVKCPRGDCYHYELPADESPCRTCTCNHKSSSLCRTFNYTSKSIEKTKKKPSPQKKGDGTGHSDSDVS